jgi:predicted TPR repeat methyltransferase
MQPETVAQASPLRPPNGATELSLDDALRYAVELHRADRFEGAEALYRRILEAAPDHPDALHFLGVLMHRFGRSDEAIGLIRRAIEIVPSHPDCHMNLGNIYAETERYDEAIQSYRQVLALRPDNADTYNNLGVTLRVSRRPDEARAAYLQAIALDPRHVNAHNNMGLLHAARGEIKEAVACYCHAITLIPNHPHARQLLGIAYYTTGRYREAGEVFRQWLEDEPGNPVATHMHAACTGLNVPDRASDDYVETTFDKFADSFDTLLQSNLGYRAPQVVAQAFARHHPSADKSLHILDAGCGTGLCGPLIAPYAAKLIGVDLSGRMLAKAVGKEVYDALEKAELTAYLAAQSANFDVIVSADTLVYFGRLDEVAAASHRALRAGGALVFSVEDGDAANPAEGFRINAHGRYSHTTRYVTATLEHAGFVVESIDREVLRNEGGEPVHGLVVLATKRINR